MLDNITRFWLTNTGVSAARLYWENKVAFFVSKGVKVRSSPASFPDELYQAPRSWAEQAYPHLVRAPQGRPLRRLGAAAAPVQRAPRRVPVAAELETRRPVLPRRGGLARAARVSSAAGPRSHVLRHRLSHAAQRHTYSISACSATRSAQRRVDAGEEQHLSGSSLNRGTCWRNSHCTACTGVAAKDGPF